MKTPMQRRQFISGMAAGVGTLGLTQTNSTAETSENNAQQYYELRIHHVVNADQLKLVESYLETAFLPAMERQSVGPVGVFLPIVEGEQRVAQVYTLITYPDLPAMVTARDAIAKDEAYLKAAESYYNQPLRQPGYQRIENRLMRAFAGMPKLELPSKESSERLIELRIYESHNEHKARLKVEMFNEGEIDIMKDVKLGPVFFGETIVSNDVPNLTYMLSADSPEAHAEHWKGFRTAPAWQKMKKMARYKETVSKIRSVKLKPTSYSQV